MQCQNYSILLSWENQKQELSTATASEIIREDGETL